MAFNRMANNNNGVAINNNGMANREEDILKDNNNKAMGLRIEHLRDHNLLIMARAIRLLKSSLEEYLIMPLKMILWIYLQRLTSILIDLTIFLVIHYSIIFR
jgi:hypothetical protein